MPARQSAETKHAVYLYLSENKSIRDAARIAGVWPQTLRRALETLGKWERKKRVDSKALRS